MLAPPMAEVSMAASETLRLGWPLPSLECSEPGTKLPVLVDLNFRLGRKSKWSLYSTGPSCGSACSLVILRLLFAPNGDKEVDLPSMEPFFGTDTVVLSASSDAPRKSSNHGDATLGGSGSYVNMDAMVI